MWLDHKLSPSNNICHSHAHVNKKDLSINLFLVSPHASCIPSLWSHFHALGLQGGTSAENVREIGHVEGRKRGEIKEKTHLQPPLNPPTRTMMKVSPHVPMGCTKERIKRDPSRKGEKRGKYDGGKVEMM